jgi:hypothetical protein
MLPGSALLLLTVPWLLVFAHIDKYLIAGLPSLYAVWIEVACILIVGFLSTWVATLWSTYDAPIRSAGSVQN